FGLQQAQAGWLDLWRLHQGYEAYRKGDYNASKEIFAAIRPPLLESTYALASAYYKLGAYKKAGRLYLKCKSTDPLIKRRIWYNLGNCAMKLGRYKSARDYYVKALQLGYDEEALENLKLALFLHERRQKRIEARANKKVEAQSSSGSSDQTKGSEKKASRSQSKMGQGSGSQSAAKSSRVGPKKGTSEATERYELGSKAYELINKGYVHEKRPW
ncbi:tetratricopeptide repeat protein, partial [Hydrogenimonas sp.]